MAQAQYALTGIPQVEVVTRGARTYTVLEVPSSNGKKTYRVDMTNRRCSCPGWIFSKERKMCKHLKAFGFADMVRKSEVVNLSTYKELL